MPHVYHAEKGKMMKFCTQHLTPRITERSGRDDSNKHENIARGLSTGSRKFFLLDLPFLRSIDTYDQVEHSGKVGGRKKKAMVSSYHRLIINMLEIGAELLPIYSRVSVSVH